MPTDCAVAYSRAHQWQANVEELIEKIGPVSRPANVGFLYLTDHLAQHAEQIRLRLNQALELDVLIGTVGFGVFTNGQEFMNEPAYVLMVIELAAGSFQEISHSKRDIINSLGSSDDFPVAIVHSDPDLAERITSPEVLGDIFLTGALTASRTQSLQLHTSGSLLKGMTGLLLTESCNFRTTLSQGCSPIGPQHVITKCQDHIIIELDNRPALDVLYEDAGKKPETMDELEALCSTTLACIGLPNRDTNDFVARHLVGIDPTHKAIGIAHNPNQDDPLTFSQRNPENAQKDLKQVLEQLRDRLPAPPVAGLYFSCTGRGENLFGESDVEPKLIHEIFGDLPLVGFFGSGEFYQDEIYGYTGVLGLFC